MFFQWITKWCFGFSVVFVCASFKLPNVDDEDIGDKKDLTCAAGFYQCARRHYCISETWVCDGEEDCLDGSDEENCTNKTTQQIYSQSTQPLDEAMIYTSPAVPYISSTLNFHATSTTTTSLSSLASSTSRVTPKTRQSTSQSVTTPAGVNITSSTHTTRTSSLETTIASERKCLGIGIFKCSHDSRCVPTIWVCDGEKDCIDGSDEANCGGSSTPSDVDSETKPNCDMNLCSSCIEKPPNTRCPKDFVVFEGHCMLVNPFPQKWLRAREYCRQNSAVLAQFSYSGSHQRMLQQFLLRNGLIGLNYWIGKPLGGNKLPEKEMQIPRWLLNGRKTIGQKYPAYINNCYFLDYYDLDYYKSRDCNEYGGVICFKL